MSTTYRCVGRDGSLPCFSHRLRIAGRRHTVWEGSSWDDVPDDQGYGPMRDAIVRHVRELIDTLR